MSNYDLNKHKKSDKIKWIITGVAFVLVFVFLAGLCMQLFGKGKIKPSEWFKKTEQVAPAAPDGSEEDGGAIVTDNEMDGDGVQIKSRKLMRTEYEENGISAQADTAFTLTATVLPEEAFDKSVDWSIAWQNANSEWANGKNISDYYSITPTSDGACTANAVCKQAFAEPVIITCKLRTADISATVKADYVSKLLNLGFNAPSYELGNYGSYFFRYTPEWSIGTITGGVINIQFIQLNFPVEFSTLVSDIGSSSDFIEDYFGGEIVYDASKVYLYTGNYGDDWDEEFAPFWTDIVQPPSDASPSDRLRAMNVFHKGIFDYYGNVVKYDYLTYTLRYSYTIDGQTKTVEAEFPAALDIDVSVAATSVSVNEVQLKH